MGIHLFDSPHYLNECIALLSDYANEETYELSILEMVKKYNIAEQEIAPLFQAQILMQIGRAHV